MEMKHILVATDGSKSAQKALEFAADLAKAKDAKLTIVHAQRVHGSETVPSEIEEFSEVENMRMTERDLYAEIAARIAREAERAAHALGVTRATAITVEGDPTRSIVEAAKDRQVDAIVIGSRGVGDFEGLLLGSVSHKVAHLAPCTCIIVR